MADETQRTQPIQATQQANQHLLEVIYAIKSLAQTMEFIHSDLKRLLEDEGRDRDRGLDRAHESLAKIHGVLQSLPVATADRVENAVNKKVDGVLDDTRRVLDDVRMKLWIHLGAPRGPDASGSGMTVRDGVPVPIPSDVTGRITLHDDGNMRLEGKINATKIAKIYAIGKWVVVGFASIGGIAGIVQLVRAIIKAL